MYSFNDLTLILTNRPNRTVGSRPAAIQRRIVFSDTAKRPAASETVRRRDVADRSVRKSGSSAARLMGWTTVAVEGTDNSERGKVVPLARPAALFACLVGHPSSGERLGFGFWALIIQRP